MKKHMILATTFGILLSGTALAEDLPPVTEISSSTDLTAIQNEEAAAYWANLDADLESAIAARLVERLGENGLSIAVKIDEVKLSNALEQVLEPDVSVLAGDVRVNDLGNERMLRSFEISVTARQVMPLLPEGTDVTILPADSPEFYEVLIDAFADGVVRHIDD